MLEEKSAHSFEAEVVLLCEISVVYLSTIPF